MSFYRRLWQGFEVYERCSGVIAPLTITSLCCSERKKCHDVTKKPVSIHFGTISARWRPALVYAVQAMGYYAGMLAYYWVLVTPAVGLLFGCYLYVAVNLFHCHYDEAFSALRIPHYKGFSRLHLTREGNLVIYALAMDQVMTRHLQSMHLPRL